MQMESNINKCWGSHNMRAGGQSKTGLATLARLKIHSADNQESDGDEYKLQNATLCGTAERIPYV